MKVPKPGQFWSWNGIIFKLYKKEDNCKGCFFENKMICPNIPDKKGHQPLDCITNPIILKRI